MLHYRDLEKVLTNLLCVQVTMPLSNVIILTDPESDLHIDKERVTAYPIQGEYSRDKLMLQRIRSYIVRVHCAEFTSGIIFIFL